MQGSGFWINPNGKVVNVLRKHINYVMENLDEFGLTREEFNSYFDKYAEKYGFEGKARAELFVELFKKGWIRIREWADSGWTIELWDLNDKQKIAITEWAKNFGKHQSKYASENIKIHIFEKQHQTETESNWVKLLKMDKALRNEFD